MQPDSSEGVVLLGKNDSWKKSLFFVHIYIQHKAPWFAYCQLWIPLTIIFASSVFDVRNWISVFNLLRWRRMMGTEQQEYFSSLITVDNLSFYTQRNAHELPFSALIVWQLFSYANNTTALVLYCGLRRQIFPNLLPAFEVLLLNITGGTSDISDHPELLQEDGFLQSSVLVGSFLRFPLLISSSWLLQNWSPRFSFFLNLPSTYLLSIYWLNCFEDTVSVWISTLRHKFVCMNHGVIYVGDP